ncbi:MAG: S-layer homology domain-containing protein [Candidatus Gracilibacteria bacterium]|jgi:uncharacterized protein YkwD
MQLKKISKLLIIAIALSNFLLPQSVFASFPDVQSSHKNYTAIIYLQENGIIKGYSDNTFKPDNLVNRVEFLKIMIEGSGIITDISTKTPFSDINDQAWYAPYVRKAYDSGWIQGYADNTFKPSQTITKAEALKILGKAQNWQIPETVTTAPFLDSKLTDWFTPYVEFAKEKELLEETGRLFFPNEEMSRAKISETVYRSIIEGLSILPETTKNPASETVETQPEANPISPVPETQTNETAQEQAEIPSNFYTNISLDSSIPNTFYQNELYIIKGTVTSGSYKEATVAINKTTFTESLSNKRFEIPVIFRNTGNFSLGILPGTSGNTKIQTISVLPTLPSSTNKDIPPLKLTPEIIFSNGKTSVNFQNISSTIKKLTLSQGTKSISYITRQNENEISIFYEDFQNFSESSISYSLESAKISSSSPLIISSEFSKSNTETFIPTLHEFSFIDENATASPPEKMASPSQISFTVTTSTEIDLEGYVTKPDGFVEEINLSKNNNTYAYSYTPKSSGTYIVEVNNSEGIAVVNHPVYIGNEIPILPNFFDTNKREYFTGTVQLDSLRNEMLDKINKARRDHGLNEISMSDELNTLAQLHSDDMAKNNYFSHTDLSGNLPEDRRKTLGISTPVAENLAKDVSVNFAHEGLMRSGSHRENILEGEWTHVGIGIAKTQNDGGYLLVTQEFSTDEITSEDLISMKEKLFTKINEQRATNTVPALTADVGLDNASKYLNDKIIKENATLTNQVFSDTLDSFNISGASEAIGRSYNIWSTILDSILNDEPTLTAEDWLKIGIDVQTDSEGIINILVIINK